MFSDSQIIDILSNLKKVASCFEYKIGQFKINIFLDQIQDHIEFGPNDKITDHEIFDVHLFELKKYIKHDKEVIVYEYIYSKHDLRFKNCKALYYEEWHSIGRDMPLQYLIELIKHLERLTQLTVFI